jgi:endonuclease I
MNFILTTFFCLIFSATFAQIPTGYYNAAQGLSGDTLKQVLHNIIKNHTSISYTSLWTAYKKTDKKINGFVWDMYSDLPSGTPPYNYTFIIDQCGSYANEGDCYNREHSWPQSWFNSVAGPQTDMFHVVPTDGKVNGKRDNYPYGTVSNPTWTSLNGSKLGPSIDSGYNKVVFEPIDDYKGDLARGYLYMTTRYLNEDASWSFSDATNGATILPWQLKVLLQWHHQDTVSAKEIVRNDSIYYHFQNNRNPFIDHPEWADSIWKNKIIIAPVGINKPLTFNTVIIYPNPSIEQIKIEFEEFPYECNITDVSGRIIEKSTISTANNFVNCSQWNSGLYFISVKSKSQTFTSKLIKKAN